MMPIGEHSVQVFAECLSLFLERIFMILTVNADESIIRNHDGQLEYLVMAAYIGTKEQWQQFATDWKSVLERYNVPGFHFREFHAKGNTTDPSSPYFQWPREKRDDFFFDLAMAVGYALAPVGGAYSAKKHREHSLSEDVLKSLFGTFFTAVVDVLNRHWPEVRGQDLKNKVNFVFDNSHKKWRESVSQVFDECADQDPRFGGMSFQSDTDPAHIGLQAADFIAAIYRQNAQRTFETGKLQRARLIDFILFKNFHAAGSELHLGTSPVIFRAIVEELRKHEKRQKREWAENNIEGMKYYPADHLGSIAEGLIKRSPEIMAQLKKEENGKPNQNKRRHLKT